MSSHLGEMGKGHAHTSIGWMDGWMDILRVVILKDWEKPILHSNYVTLVFKKGFEK
jgi:hypothetical protein